MLVVLELKGISKIILANLLPKTESIIVPMMSRVASKHIGMANLFLRYQERLINITESVMKTTVKKIVCRPTQFEDKDMHLNIDILLVQNK